MRLHRDLGITQKSAYFMAQRLREAWSDPEGGMRALRGRLNLYGRQTQEYVEQETQGTKG